MSKEATLTTLNKSTNWFKATGFLSEKYSMIKDKNTDKMVRKPMMIENTTRPEYADGKPTGKNIPCQKVFGGIILKTQYGVCEFRVNFSSKNSDGSNSQKWPMALAIVNEWNPAIGGNGSDPSFVTVSGSVSYYDSYSPKSKETKIYYNWDASAKCDRVERVVNDDGEDNSGCTLHLVGLLKGKVWEPDRKDPEETTGRLKVTLMCGDGKGECFPVNVIIDEELAEDFNDGFELGETLDCMFERNVRMVGGTKKESTGRELGKKKKSSQDMNNSFPIEELVLNTVTPIDEPDELVTEDEDGNEIEVKTQWINPKTMKAAIKIREEKLAQIKANEGKKTNAASSASMADAIARGKKRTMGKQKPVVEDFEEYEDFEDVVNEDGMSPFDTEDDEW